MERQNGGLEDDFPFQLGVFSGASRYLGSNGDFLHLRFHLGEHLEARLISMDGWALSAKHLSLITVQLHHGAKRIQKR